MRHVVCLYENSGYSGYDWAVNGYEVFCYDILHRVECTIRTGAGVVHSIPWDARKPGALPDLVARHKGSSVLLLAFPPCTDLAVSGAAHFRAKFERNPNYRSEAMELVLLADRAGQALECPYAIENPVSVISTAWRRPDRIFHPYEYGGYLPEDDSHPHYPEYIAPRDAYPKKTCYWTGGGFVMPEKKPVPVPPGYSIQHRKLGGKSEKTKKNPQPVATGDCTRDLRCQRSTARTRKGR